MWRRHDAAIVVCDVSDTELVRGVSTRVGRVCGFPPLSLPSSIHDPVMKFNLLLVAVLTATSVQASWFGSKDPGKFAPKNNSQSGKFPPHNASVTRPRTHFIAQNTPAGTRHSSRPGSRPTTSTRPIRTLPPSSRFASIYIVTCMRAYREAHPGPRQGELGPRPVVDRRPVCACPTGVRRREGRLVDLEREITSNHAFD
jgi:hypothetical protein